MPEVDRDRLRSIHTFPSLVKYLRDELDWPVETHDFEELTFDYAPHELIPDAKIAAKIQEIKQLRPLTGNQPWGIFFVKFEPRRLPVVVMRRILRSLVIRKRQTARPAERPAWHTHDLLFVSSYGEEGDRAISFAHFSDPEGESTLPTLRVLDWDDKDTVPHLDHAHETLKEKLRWPDDEEDLETWRTTWGSAFTLRPREVIRTSKKLAQRMAELATRIRNRANTVLEVETENGPLTKLYKAFQEALIHDLKPDDFADMYAQTVTYGLFAAAMSRTIAGEGTALVAENLSDMVPVTNPFLKELLGTFLEVGGKRGHIDFDELGVNEVVDLMLDADLEAVKRDFGDLRQEEDPVIHFYEDFLREYDAKKKIQRGIFFTPRPVVSFIVRSVHEILQTEFGLEDGLADTTTWGEMAERHAELEIPEGVSRNEPFVQILDPACGTGTFLVEVIELTHKTMVEKWRQEGHMDLNIPDLWNRYVPEHLLPRLYGFEIMMAPYTICHMKVGLKLDATGYRFGAEERVRVYLTNSLEPPHDFSDTFRQMAPALAHEAQAVNNVKRHQQFTVVTGNPPYAQYSMNLSEEAKVHIEPFRYANGQRIQCRNPLQLERNLNDDYVKFLGFSLSMFAPGSGVLGMITNRMFLDSGSLVGLRQWLATNFERLSIVDLWGSSEEARRVPRLADDENVFDIRQGVAITFAVTRSQRAKLGETAVTRSFELVGTRAHKYATLTGGRIRDDSWVRTRPGPETWWLHRIAGEECPVPSVSLDNIFSRFSTLIASNRDHLVVAMEPQAVAQNVEALRDFRGSNEAWAQHFGITLKTGWDATKARHKLAQIANFADYIQTIEYRPFDRRYIFFHPALVWQTAPVISNNILHDSPNRVLVSLGKNRAATVNGQWMTATLADKSVVSSRDNASGFPLYLYEYGELTGSEDARRPNLSCDFLDELATHLGLAREGPFGLPTGIASEDIFDYIYAIVNSPGYRSSFAEALTNGFPPIPLPCNRMLFDALRRLGADLASLHLMKSALLDNPLTTYVGPANPVVEKVGYSGQTVWLDRAKTRGFSVVSEEVWNFRIGGYQVCEKWLKDRKGRQLSADDIAHYQKIVVALAETIRLMTEIDKTIDAHGGWPGAFITDPKVLEGLKSKKA